MPHSLFLDNVRSRIEGCLDQYLPQEGVQPTRLHRAMRYAALNPGKRLRPALVYATGELLSVNWELLDAPAAAVEMIHAYSLIHDDLPCMDDDDLRRGLPTCHIAFDQATAVLAGDALQTQAFEVLASATQINEATRLKMLLALSQASGSLGMGGGQAIDLAMTNQQNQGTRSDLETLESMHQMKTGALITICLVLGYLVSEINDEKVLKSLKIYGESLGLAFQIRDDILDIESDTETLGKPQGSDQNHNKLTFPALLGMEGAKKRASELTQKALDVLDELPYKSDNLALFANYIIERDY